MLIVVVEQKRNLPVQEEFYNRDKKCQLPYGPIKSMRQLPAWLSQRWLMSSLELPLASAIFP